MSSSHDPSASEERQLLLAQYQLAVESADRYDNQRSTVDKFFVTVISTLVLLGGLLSVLATPPSGRYLRASGSILILSSIVILCIAWLEYVRRSYSTSLMKRHVIRTMEQSEVYSLPYRPFLIEYKLWRSYNLAKCLWCKASKGKLRRLATISTMWPYTIGWVSLVLMVGIYLLAIESSLDDDRVIFGIWLGILSLGFVGSFSWNLIKQSNLARELDKEPDIEALL